MMTVEELRKRKMESETIEEFLDWEAKEYAERAAEPLTKRIWRTLVEPFTPRADTQDGERK